MGKTRLIGQKRRYTVVENSKKKYLVVLSYSWAKEALMTRPFMLPPL